MRRALLRSAASARAPLRAASVSTSTILDGARSILSGESSDTRAGDKRLPDNLVVRRCAVTLWLRASAPRPFPPSPLSAAAAPLMVDAPLPPLSPHHVARTHSQYDNAHLSNAEDLIADVPVILVKGGVALCDGGGGALGHPVEYIQLAKAFNPHEPQDCPYCGLRYQTDPNYHGGGH